MTTSIDETQRYDASPEDVFDMLCDPDFIREKCRRSGSIDVDAEVKTDGRDRVRLWNHRKLPAKLPSFAKRFVGDTVVLEETQNWRAPADDGSRAAGFVVDFGNNPISFTGAIELHPDGDGTVVATTGAIKCSVPLAGGQIEKVAKQWITKYVTKEQTVGQEWLAGRRPT